MGDRTPDENASPLMGVGESDGVGEPGSTGCSTVAKSVPPSDPPLPAESAPTAPQPLPPVSAGTLQATTLTTTALPAMALPTAALPAMALPAMALPTAALPAAASALPTAALPAMALATTAPPTTNPTLPPDGCSIPPAQAEPALPRQLDAIQKRRELRRGLLCFACAVVIHAGATLFGAEGTERVAHAAYSAPELSTLVDVAVATPPPGEGEAPGGGSPEPAPHGADEALPERPKPAPPEAPKVAPEPEVREDTRLADVAPETEPDPDAEPASGPDILTTENLEAPDLGDTVRPTPIRHAELTPAKRPTATAPVVAASNAQRSRHYGLGPGRGGGPGGVGRGWGNGNGVVKERFAFGGPTGAFRADVCFIPEHTKSLASIRDCPREATFFTDTLDVSPRRFNAGFPGVSARSEWFAIRYQGKFTVSTAGQYSFRLISDDGAKVWIDGFLIIDLDGTHPPSMKDGNMRLMQGEHELFVSYFQGPRDNIALQLFVTPPDSTERILTPRL